MTVKTSKFIWIKESLGDEVWVRDDTFWSKQGSKLTVRKHASHTSCFGTAACHHPCFGTWAVTSTQTSKESQLPRMNVKSGDSKMPNLFLTRSAPLTHWWWKRLKIGNKGQHTVLYSMNINRYSEFHKVKISRVKYFELGLPGFSLTYMPAMCVSSFHTTAQSNALDQSIIIPVYTPWWAHTHTHTSYCLFLKPHSQYVQVICLDTSSKSPLHFCK